VDDNVAVLVAELVEKVGLLRREIEHQGDDARYAARVARVGQKVAALAEALAQGSSAAAQAQAKAVLTAWEKPARSLAFRNAAHRPD
jgi:hypothetical protein